VKTVVVTGATGVVGSALVPALSGCRLVCLAHDRHGDAGAATWIHGDLTRPWLGVGQRELRRLARRADAIVHCAAITDFTVDPRRMDALNVRGTDAVLELAALAGAPLYYVSTAFVARAHLARPGSGPESYLASKRRAEEHVRASGLPAVVIRPSVVVGDAATGAVARFQGLHALAGAVLRNALPFVPLRADARIDFVPQDLVAACIAELVRRDVTGGDWWLTGGAEAVPVAQLFDACVGVARELGLDVVPPRLIAPDALDRLVRPVFIDPLPEQARRRVDQLIDMTVLFDAAEPLSSSVAALGQPVSSARLEAAFAQSMRYWAARKGLGEPERIAA
jgi:nucleoside-diphosphate-sugar epimerase